MAKQNENAQDNFNPMDDFVQVNLPRATGKESTDVFVQLNGKSWMIRRGVTVRVPRPVYDVLMESFRAQTRRDEYIDELHRAQAARAVELGMR